MKRRDFLATMAASGALSVLDPAYFAAQGRRTGKDLKSPFLESGMVGTAKNSRSSASAAWS